MSSEQKQSYVQRQFKRRIKANNIKALTKHENAVLNSSVLKTSYGHFVIPKNKNTNTHTSQTTFKNSNKCKTELHGQQLGSDATMSLGSEARPSEEIIHNQSDQWVIQ